MSIEEMALSATRVTHGPRHHYFGYYDKQQLDPSGRYLLGMACDFIDRPQRPDDLASLGMIDLQGDCQWILIGETRAWCWQQGCMLQWVPQTRSSVIYNDREGDSFVSVLLDVLTGEKRIFPRPVYALSPDGKQAVSVNFSRIARCRPGYGYYGGTDPSAGAFRPEDDGIWRLDLETGDHEPIVSIAHLAGNRPREEFAQVAHWVNHLLFSPDGSRFSFLHRWGKGGFQTRLYTAGLDGSNLCLLNDNKTSHYDWFDTGRILAWADRPESGSHYHLFTDKTREVEVIGEDVLDCDGHCSVSPNREWILTDTYPNEAHERTLILFHRRTGRRVNMGWFYSMPELTREIRCDLHPRWMAGGDAVCFDSTHERARQMYMMDVSGVVSGRVCAETDPV